MAQATEVPRARLEKRCVTIGKAAEDLEERSAALAKGVQREELLKLRYRVWKLITPLLPPGGQQEVNEKENVHYHIPKKSLGVPLPAPVRFGRDNISVSLFDS